MIDPALRETIAKRFPFALVYLNVPEIADLIQKAVDEEWTPDTFEANLKGTQWYAKRTDSERAWFAIETGNPGEATARVNARKQDIKTLAYQLGQEISDDQAGAYAWQSLREGWSEKDLKYNIAGVLQPAGTSVGPMNIRQLANEYMVNLTDDKVTDLSRKAFAGLIDEAGLRSMLAAQAASQFPSLAELINKGTVPSDYFDPYRQMISKFTDTPSAQVDFNSPTWSKILSYATPDGKLRPMTIDEAKRYVRSTDEFANSDTGRAEVASFQVDLEKMFGARV